MLCINLVECSEVTHLGQEAGGFHNVFHGDTGSLQNGSNVFAALLSLCCNTLGDFSGGGIYRDLTGSEDKIAHGNALRIGADCAGSVGGGDDILSMGNALLFNDYVYHSTMEKKGQRKRGCKKILTMLG